MIAVTSLLSVRSHNMNFSVILVYNTIIPGAQKGIIMFSADIRCTLSALLSYLHYTVLIEILYLTEN
jgi:hypothetical protein